MKLKVIPNDGSEPFEVEVTKENGRGSINQYIVKHTKYKGFQYDSSDRPNNYSKEYAETRTFHGFLIARKGYETLECYRKIIYGN